MAEWFHSQAGQAILSQERHLIDQCRKEFRGDHQAQISILNESLLGQPNPRALKTMMVLSSLSDQDKEANSLACMRVDADALPLSENGVDFLLLHHCLEFADDPHAALREAVRVLSPQGQLLIVCFNPYSLLGLWKRLQLVLGGAIPWAHHGLSKTRIVDWLRLTECEPLNVAWGFYAIPIQAGKFLSGFGAVDRFLTHQSIPGGGFFVIHATKNTSGWVGPVARARTQDIVRFPSVVAASRSHGEARHLSVVVDTEKGKITPE